jgi:hypothetical protein
MLCTMLSSDYRITTPLQSLSPHSGRRHLFLTGREWRIGLLVSAAAGVGATWVSLFISVWIGVTVFFVTLTAYHMRHASLYIVPFPHIAILISALQYVLAAWIGFYYPPQISTYDIGAALPLYLSYGGPVVVAICVGWSLSLIRLKPTPQPAFPTSAKMLTEMDILLVVGLVTFFVGRHVEIPSLAFVFVLIANLRYVAVYGRMIVRGAGWGWRLAIVVGSEVLFAAESAMFHPLLLWTCWTVAVWMYCVKPSGRSVLCMLLAGALFLPAFQETKWRLRAGADDDLLGASETNATVQNRLSKTWTFVSYLASSLKHAATLDLNDDFIADTAVRYNQGWIVNRVMFFVPDIEPYAKGYTIKTAAMAAVLPRAIAEEKLKSGGQEYMAQYAGMELDEKTAMNLGYAGEMYANFGLVGGVIGCGVYALVFGLLFRWFCQRAFLNPFWWSLVPFIFFAALKAEDGIADTLNWTVKSCIVIAGIYFVFPGFRAALNGQQGGPLPGLNRPSVPLKQHSSEA